MINMLEKINIYIMASQKLKCLLKIEGNRCTDSTRKVKEWPFAEGNRDQ
jgi:hydroxymethylglutaryl-CoA reductase